MVKFFINVGPESLVQLSQIAVCQNLWADYQITESIKLKVKRDLLKNEWHNLNSWDDECDSIFEQVCHNVDQLTLPLTLKKNLKVLAKKVGHRLWDNVNTTERNRRQIPIDLEKYLDHIKWTALGDIDFGETIRSMYNSGALPNDEKTWIALTKCCLTKCIIHYVQRVESLDTLTPVELNWDNVLPLFWARLMQHRFDNFEHEFISIVDGHSRYFDGDDYKAKRIEVNLLRYAGQTVNHEAAKFFWQFLGYNERIDNLYDFLDLYQMSNCQSVVFFATEASLYEIEEFFIDMLCLQPVLFAFTQWPYDNLLRRSLEISWSQFNDNDFEQALNGISRASCWNWRFYIDSFWVVKEMWRRIRADHKMTMDCTKILSYMNWCPEFVSCIINDPAVRAKRDEYIAFIADDFNNNLEFRIKDVIMEFCQVALKTEEERQAFKSIIRFDEVSDSDDSDAS